MPYDLYNPSTTICRKFSRQFFAKALELGRLYGWDPMGTDDPPKMAFYRPIADWDGGYLTNDGQKVKAADAKKLAEALETSLGDISDLNPAIHWDPRLWADDLPDWFTPEEREFMEEELQEGLLDILGVHPVDFFAGDEKRYLVEFIRFCRLGSFVIL